MPGDLTLPFPPGIEQVPYLSGVTRESLYETLQVYLQYYMGLNAVYRNTPNWSNINITDSPVGFLEHLGSKPQRPSQTLYPFYIDRNLLWVAINQQTADPNSTLDTQINNLRDNLDVALSTDQNAFGQVCTLAGRAMHCWVSDDTWAGAFTQGAWTGFRSLIEIRYITVGDS
jgi:hypothetical protein